MKNTLVGRATYINGDVQEFTDAGWCTQTTSGSMKYMTGKGLLGTRTGTA